MIMSFRDRDAEKIFERIRVTKFDLNLQKAAARKLNLLDAAECLNDLRLPPGNRLEKLGGDRKGRYSIRINDQWRICFRWKETNAYEIEIVDYH